MAVRQIALDTETTGLDHQQGHRVIEIGCVELINRRLTGKRFHYYLNPDRAIDRGAQNVHGITTEFLADKPRFRDIADTFLNFIKGAELIIHNAPFDVGFLNNELSFIGMSLQISDHAVVFDTLTLARQMHPGQRNNLDALCKRYSIDNSHRELHGALMDAEILARVYLAMTGGQAALFHDENALAQVFSQDVIIRKQHEVKTRVILPTIEELAAHSEYSTWLKEKSGKDFWKEEVES